MTRSATDARSRGGGRRSASAAVSSLAACIVPAAAVARPGISNHSIGRLLSLPWRRRPPSTVQALRRLRDDAYRVHEALDDLRHTFHAASPGIVALGDSLGRVRRSLDGTGAHIADLGRAVARGLRRGAD
jgi:hypothetical protein